MILKRFLKHFVCGWDWNLENMNDSQHAIRWLQQVVAAVIKPVWCFRAWNQV